MTSEHTAWAGDVRALTFDTGGTVLDWFGTISESFDRLAGERGERDTAADRAELTRAWRRSSTDLVKELSRTETGEATIDMDGVLARTLDQTLDDHGVTWPTGEDRAALVAAWRSMRPWPDVTGALPRLRRHHVAAPFTIMKTALVLAASRTAGIEWDAVFSCEMIGTYKTHPRTYATVARWLDLRPAQILMVTTHNDDLAAAHRAGYRTAFVHRPHEWGDVPSPHAVPDARADLVVDDLHALADALGA